jgi:peptidoglycan/xylan/chitin deacetylase (PgdA/CDA1 family)
LPVLPAVIILFIVVFLVWKVRFGHPNAVHPPVLCFHKISTRFCWEGTWTTPKRLFAYVDRLRRTGYRFVGMEEYLDCLDTGNHDGRSLLLTFDDGYRELYDIVLPALEARGVPFHVFVVTDYVGGTNEWDLSLGRRSFRHLDWRQMKEMASRGVTFGSHGASHRDLTRLDAAQTRAELKRSKAVIEAHLGKPVRTLSYPFGRYNESVRLEIRELGFDAAFSLYPAHHNRHFDPHAIRRNCVYIIDPVGLIESKWKPGPLFWMEEMKCRAINSIAVLTPIFKSLSRSVSGRAQGT